MVTTAPRFAKPLPKAIFIVCPLKWYCCVPENPAAIPLGPKFWLWELEAEAPKEPKGPKELKAWDWELAADALNGLKGLE